MSKETIYIPNYTEAMNRYYEEYNIKTDYLNIRLVHIYYASRGYKIEFNKNHIKILQGETIIRSYYNEVKYRDDQINKIVKNE